MTPQTETAAGAKSGPPDEVPIAEDNASQETIQTSVFAREIEASFVCLLWRHPEYLGEALRAINPAIHISQPHLRLILNAVNDVHSYENTADFALVATYLRQSGDFGEVGGLQGLNDAYTDSGRQPCGWREPEPIFKYYLELLLSYADARLSGDPLQIPVHLAGGWGRLVPNPVRRREASPVAIGRVMVAGKRYKASAWREAAELRLKFVPEPTR
jgi:hypothetical protein